MSRRLEKTLDGQYETFIVNKDECRWLIDDVCCDADSDFVGDFPDKEDCKNCFFFTKEEVEQ